MNIHPALVHFPIALLTLYAVLELLSFSRLVQGERWAFLKLFLIIFGAGGAFMGLLSGEAAAELRGMSQVVEIHEQWAKITLFSSGLVAFSYILFFLRSNFVPGTFLAKVGQWAESFQGSFLSRVLALFILASVTITGALGGSLVYGKSADPIVGLVHSLFVPQAEEQKEASPAENSAVLPTSTPSSADSPKPTPTPSKPTGGSGSGTSVPTPPPSEDGVFTMSEVAKHNSATSCYSVVRGTVYDLTNWIKGHPGGAKAILKMCGADGTEEFVEKHGGDGRPEATLSGFEIGVLK